MAIDEAKFKQLKYKADQARQERDRATGQLEATMARLAKEFGCTTLDAAKKKAAKLDKEAATAEINYEEAVTVFEKVWNEHFES